MKHRSYRRRGGGITGSAYKRKEWKQKMKSRGEFVPQKGWNSRGRGGGGGGGAGTSGACFKCGQEGHWAKNCRGPKKHGSNLAGGLQRRYVCEWTFCMTQSHGTKSTMLDGKRMWQTPKQSDFNALGHPKQREVKLDWLKSLYFGGCHILLPSRMAVFRQVTRSCKQSGEQVPILANLHGSNLNIFIQSETSMSNHKNSKSNRASKYICTS